MPGPLSLAMAMLLAIAAPAASAEAPAVPDPAPPGLPAALPLRRDGPVAQDGSGNTLLALLLLAGAGGAWAGWRRIAHRRVSPPQDSSGLRIVRVGSQALTPQASLHAVQWNGEDLLLACTGQEVTVLARRTAEPGRETAA